MVAVMVMVNGDGDGGGEVAVSAWRERDDFWREPNRI
jgi:hypothetical protein